MKIASVGGGPAGLYFSILMKQAFPKTDIVIYERNKPDDTFGWGVVFSRETLGHFKEADPESYAAIEAEFAYWDDIETFRGNERIVSTGHGFCGLSRRQLLMILHERARKMGVELHFQHEIKSLAEVGPADLILAVDGVNSFIREQYAQAFKPSIDWRKCKFCWLGTTKTLKNFTFVFKDSPHGLFQVHAYPFEKGQSTWIVECREETWKKAGLDKATEADTVAFCEKLFAEELGGHKLLTNKSIWRTFPTIKNEKWHHENVVLMGDAAHTAHFSIGSGTKLAMEDAIALVEAFKEVGEKKGAPGTFDVPTVLARYEEKRRVDVLKIQRAAQTSLEWFENSERYMKQPLPQLQVNLMTRSKRITYDNLKERDPALIARFDEHFAKEQATPKSRSGVVPPPMFAPFKLRELSLSNRVAVSPMCQYSAVDGTPNDWHLVHLGSRAVGGAGLVVTEMTNVSPEGRITHGCAGLYTAEQAAAWKRVVDFIHGSSQAKVAIQLAHAGRKASCSRPWEGDRPLAANEQPWQAIAPSALPFSSKWPTPKEMDEADLVRIREAFVHSAKLAEQAGFDMLELHAAHGYLLSSFLSPLSNQRKDKYGGTLENRMRYLLEVFDAVRAVWPKHKPISVRISASDWLEPDGMTVDDSVAVAKALKAKGCDLIDVSSAGNVPQSRPDYGRMYQVPFAEKIRYEAGIPVMAVGAIQNADHVNTVVAAGRADLCALARPHLADPYLTLHAAIDYGYDAHPWPKQYLLAQPKWPTPDTATPSAK